MPCRTSTEAPDGRPVCPRRLCACGIESSHKRTGQRCATKGTRGTKITKDTKGTKGTKTLVWGRARGVPELTGPR